MKILIGYDGSSSARAALDDLRRAGLPRHTEALVGAAAEPLSTYRAVERELTTRSAAAALAVASQAYEEAEELAVEGAKLVRLSFPDWEVHAEGLAGDPSRAVLERARSWRPDLLVVGSQGRSAIGRLLLGSVSERLAAEAPTSVRIARDAAPIRDGAPLRIIVGVDGSVGAERAVRAVGRRFWPRGTELRLVAVGGDARAWISDIRPTAAQIASARSEVEATTAPGELTRMAEELRCRGLKVTVDVGKGDARRVLVERARSWGADAIFVGARGRHSRPDATGMGSVATHVAIHAPCSIEVVRRDKEAKWPKRI
jgi:nucleotide-binding universal stress UspA family protein